MTFEREVADYIEEFSLGSVEDLTTERIEGLQRSAIDYIQGNLDIDEYEVIASVLLLGEALKYDRSLLEHYKTQDGY